MLAITLNPLSIPSLEALLESSAVFTIATYCLAPMLLTAAFWSSGTLKGKVDREVAIPHPITSDHCCTAGILCMTIAC
jgi:hypothetical protein